MENKPFYKRWWFWTIIAESIVIFVLLIALFFSYIGNTLFKSNNKKSSQTTSEISNPINTTSTSKPKEKKKYSVGEKYSNNGVSIYFESVDDNFVDYSKYADVKDGYKIIKADFEFENISKDSFLASTYDFNCYADGYDCEHFWSVDNSSFTSNLSIGKKVKGSVYFEVPTNSNEITMEYEVNTFANELAEFKIK